MITVEHDSIEVRTNERMAKLMALSFKISSTRNQQTNEHTHQARTYNQPNTCSNERANKQTHELTCGRTLASMHEEGAKEQTHTENTVREFVNKSAASAASPDYVKFQAVIKSAASAASRKPKMKETKIQESAPFPRPNRSVARPPPSSHRAPSSQHSSGSWFP